MDEFARGFSEKLRNPDQHIWTWRDYDGIEVSDKDYSYAEFLIHQELSKFSRDRITMIGILEHVKARIIESIKEDSIQGFNEGYSLRIKEHMDLI